MIEVLGWTTLALGGGYAVGVLALITGTGMGLGGLERLPGALFAAAVAALAWIGFIAWLSPLTVGVAP